MGKRKSRKKRPAKRATLGLIDLPILVLRQIFSNLSFDQIAHLRPVCKAFDFECRSLLTEGACRFLSKTTSRIAIEKAKIRNFEMLPKHHKLKRKHNDLQFVFTVVKRIYDNYGEYLRDKRCCFIAGKILDEARRYVKMLDESSSERVLMDQMHEIGTALSVMAAEHFEEIVVPLYLDPKPVPTQLPFCDRCSERENMVKPKGSLSAFWKNKARKVREEIRGRKIEINRLRGQIGNELNKYEENMDTLQMLIPESKWQVELEN